MGLIPDHLLISLLFFILHFGLLPFFLPFLRLAQSHLIYPSPYHLPSFFLHSHGYFVLAPRPQRLTSTPAPSPTSSGEEVQLFDGVLAFVGEGHPASVVRHRSRPSSGAVDVPPSQSPSPVTRRNSSDRVVLLAAGGRVRIHFDHVMAVE